MEGDLYHSGNEGKADFHAVYNRPDPRAYYRTLGPLGYIIPEQAKPIFSAMIDALADTREGDGVTVLDLGCSYGINSALLKYGLSMSELYDHYTDPALADLAPDELLERDRAFFQQQEDDANLRVVGMDVADQAAAYAAEAGILDAALSVNLEDGAPSAAVAEQIADADLVISTGCVGYVTERSFNRIFDEVDSGLPPWVASFVLRVFPYEPISEALAEQGLITEKLEGRSFLQRNFVSEDECTDALRQLETLGIDPAGMEDEGSYHAEFFLSRPHEEVERLPLGRILAESPRFGSPSPPPTTIV